jgi:hypothetical protein
VLRGQGKGLIKTIHEGVLTFKEWGEIYLGLEEVKRLRSYKDRIEIIRNQLIPFFGAKFLTEIKPVDVETYRGQRRKKDGSVPCLQTVNNDHIVLKRCLNLAIKRGHLVGNPASLLIMSGIAFCPATNGHVCMRPLNPI